MDGFSRIVAPDLPRLSADAPFEQQLDALRTASKEH
jgi:hypothetical protein